MLFFASLADRAGTARTTIDVDEATDVAGLWEAVLVLHPGLRAHTPRPLAACDRAYARWDQPLAGVREVAFLPPVSGG